MLAFSLLTGREPFVSSEGQVDIERLLSEAPHYPDSLDDLAKDLIHEVLPSLPSPVRSCRHQLTVYVQLLAKDPARRLPIDQVLAHPFILKQHTRILPVIEEE